MNRWTLLVSALLVAGCSGKTVDTGSAAAGNGGDGSGGAGTGGGGVGSGGSAAQGGTGVGEAGAGIGARGGSTAIGGTTGLGGTSTGGGGTGALPDLGGRELVGTGTPVPGQITTTKIDLLLVVDNSISMADKQELLSDAVPDLVGRVTDLQADVHVGVISSSLPSPSDVCTGSEERTDNAHLVGTRPRASSLGLTDGFVSWQAGDDIAALTSSVQGLIGVVGEFGCGYEAPQEAWYRFLVDPTPPAGWAVVSCPNGGDCSVPTGIDEEILAQREAFLRPDSAVIVVVLSDENDCSYQETGQLYYMTRNIQLPAASSICATNPNDACCYNCAFGTPDGCVPDPTCTVDGSFRSVPAADDNMNLRCFDQMRRFGVDFLYPVERYVAGLTAANLPVYGGGTETNPLFSEGANGRDPSLVFMLGIVGVPWQDLASDVDASGQPLSSSDLRFQSPDELVQNGTWDVILGDPEASPPVLPTDALMIESVLPRTGTDGDGNPIAPSNGGYLENPINGHEVDYPDLEALQYACIFPVQTPRDCADPAFLEVGCDCDEPSTMDPLCQDASGAYSTVQRFAKAYPGPRHLQVLQGLEDQAAVASVCPRSISPGAPDYGYRPAIDALWERLTSVVNP